MLGASAGLTWKCTNAIRIVWSLYSFKLRASKCHKWPPQLLLVQQNCISPRNFKRLFSKKNIISFQAKSLHIGLLSTTQVDQNTADRAAKWKLLEVRSCLSRA